MRSIGPYSRPATLAKIDGRRREARLLQSVRSDLIAHVGGNPSVAQLSLIERAAWLSLHIALFDENLAAKIADNLDSEQVTLSERDGRQYLAWSNSLTRTLRELGIKSAKPQSNVPTLEQFVSSRKAAAA